MKELSYERIERLKRKVRVYEKVSLTPRHARFLARLQRIDNQSDKEIMDHYERTSKTLLIGYRQYLGVDLS